MAPSPVSLQKRFINGIADIVDVSVSTMEYNGNNYAAIKVGINSANCARFIKGMYTINYSLRLTFEPNVR
jgi:hypothetical protein